MQQNLFLETAQPDEIYSLGERYHLGIPEAAYYIAYTNADVRRYHITIVLVIAIALYLIGITVGLIIMFSDWNRTSHIFPIFTPFGSFLTLLMIIYGNSSRRKWGNRPLINRRDRHLRVYLYQDGLIRQDNRHTKIIRWSELFKVDYILSQPGNPKSPSNTRTAGIKLTLHGGHYLNLSGALLYLDDLAYRVQNHVHVL